ncbi:MAG: DUF748 domain-containing protein [Gammaproteobacteria bacterium]|nr:DUF748 domain-containing protein [Gammaproteobacteria bacterium]
MPEAPPKSAFALFLRPRLWAVLAALLAAWAALGFYAVPYFLDGLLKDTVRADYARELGIGEIRFNPFSLALEIDALSLPDADGGPMLAFDRLRVDVELDSLWHRALSFREIAVDGLVVNAIVRPGGALNLADLQPDEPQPAGLQPLPRVMVADLRLSKSRIRFSDLDRPDPFVAEIDPVDFQLDDFTTFADGGNRYRFSARAFDSGELSWAGTLQAEPLASAGEFRLAGLPLPRISAWLGDALPLDIARGSLAVQGRYEYADDSGGPTLELADTVLELAGVSLRARGNAADYVVLDSLQADGGRLSLAARQLEFASLAIDGGTVSAWLTPAGELNLPGLLGEAREAAGRPSTEVPEASPAPAGTAGQQARQQDWEIRLPAIAASKLDVQLEDRSVQPAATLQLNPLGFTLSGYTSRPGAVVKLAVDAVVNGKGRLQTAAELELDTLAAQADIELSDFELGVLQPYIARESSMTLLAGELGLKGRLGYAPAEPAAKIDFEGDVTVSALHTIDNALEEDFIKWKKLQLEGLRYRSQPESLRIRTVTAQSPYVRLIIAPDGNTNVAAILAGPGATATPASGPTLGGQPAGAVLDNPSALPPEPPPFPMQIGTVRIEDGSTNFADFTIKPNFATGIGKLKGTITGLSSDPASRAKVELDGQVDRFSPVTIRGEVNPLAAETWLDMAMNFRNIEMASFTPYSGRFAGYTIRRGKLSADLNYKLNERKLDADHRIVIDQLELGDKVESPDSIGLPLKLAVALLRDRNGVIDIELPVAGSLDDPSFRVGPIIWKVFVNLLSKAVTAPFALLGNLFGGGEELNIIAFPVGKATLDEAARQKLDALVRALSERPGLELSVPAVFSREPDTASLVESRLRRDVLRAKKAELAAKKQPADALDFELLSADRADYLRQLTTVYRKAYGAGARLPEPPAPPPGTAAVPDTEEARIARVEQAVRERIEITDDDLYALARRRAEAVQEQLLGDTGIDPARVFLSSPVEGKTADGTVTMELALR